MLYETFLPNYYGTLIHHQQNAMLLDNLYFYVADGVSRAAEANWNPKTITDEQITANQVLYGGKIQPQNLIGLIKNIEWTAGTHYGRYDANDPEMGASNFYVINSLRTVYKCINNNNGGPSTMEPTSIDQGPFTLADGYIWQYMYKVTENELLNYSIGEYIPVLPDPATAAAAIKGTISTIDVIDGGSYQGTHSGNIQHVNGDTIFRIDDSANPIENIFKGMAFFISNGPAAGKVAQIDRYNANTTGKWITTSTPIVGASVNSTYDIAPYVKITGNGTGGTARAVMQGSQVHEIQVLDRGENFTLCTAELISNASYSTAGTLITNLSPIRGHGSDVTQELFADTILINVDIDNYPIAPEFPVNSIPFSKIGLIRHLRKDQDVHELYTDNSFNNMAIVEVTPISGSYEAGDTLQLSSDPSLSAKVVHANTSHVVAVYQSNLARFVEGNMIINQNGLLGTVLSTVDPQVNLDGVDIVSITNLTTTYRDENSRETLQLVVKIK